MKKWYYSKTMWVNILSITALAIQTYMGSTPTTLEAFALGVVNIFLRSITEEKLTT